ncbi:MAG: hypothetical protein AAGH70_11465 [Pseudomonadota bacterium]
MNKIIRSKDRRGKAGGAGKKGIFGGGKQALTRPNSGGGGLALNGRIASFIWCYWGDTGPTAIGQDTLRLKKAMEGYDHTVLMKANDTQSWLDLSEADERLADVKVTPTVANFTRELCRLAEEGYIIDVFVFAHGNSSSFTAFDGSILSSTIRALPGAAGMAKLPIRMVYQTQCHGSHLNDDWRAAGAKSSVGTRAISFYPQLFGPFIKDWNKNKTFSSAATKPPSGAIKTASQVYILGDAKAKKMAGEWGGCSFGNTVLGKKSCAKEYFTYRWLTDDEWQNHLSGKQNMNYSSAMVVSGDRNIAKSSRNLSW